MSRLFEPAGNQAPKAPKLQPALLGAAFIGVLSALPYVEYGNACCCLWVVGGGVLAAYLMQESHPKAIGPGDGALVGLLAGILGAFISTILSAVFGAVRGFDRQRAIDELLETMQDTPVEMREMLQSIPEPLWHALGFVGMLIAGMIFATAGGALGALIFGRNEPLPPVPPDDSSPRFPDLL